MQGRIYFCFILLLIINPAQGQTVLFEEDFNDCALSDQWTVSLEGNQNVRWAVGKPTNPKSDSSTIDGSCMLFIDDDLTGDKTEPFVLRFYSAWFQTDGYTNVDFTAQAHFRRDGEEVFRIFADDGNKLHLIREFKGRNYAGTKFSEFVNVKSDLSFIASDSMRLVIEYDDKANWGWWAAIDNIAVTASGQGGEILLGSNFNDCTLPEGWSTEIVAGVDDWKVDIFTDGKSIDGTCFLFFNDDILGENAPLSKHRIYTPFFDADVYERYILTYDFIFRFYEKNEYFQLYVDDGTTLKPVKTYSADFGGPNVDEFLPDTIELSAFKSKRVRLVWEYNDGGWAWWLGMDNVKVIGLGNINDRCTKAIDLTVQQNCLEYNNDYALPDDEWQQNSETKGFLYYMFTPDATGQYEIKTQSRFNDVLQLATGTCDSPNLLTVIDRDEYGFEGERIFSELQAGQNYFIRVAGKEAEFGLSSGSGCIQVGLANPPGLPQEDFCLSAVPLTLGNNCENIDNINAGTEGVLPTVNLRSRADVWYSFVPDSTDEYRFKTVADFAETIALYSGSCTDLTEVASTYAGSFLDAELIAGQTYFLQISSYFSTLEGQLCVMVDKVEESTAPALPCAASNGIAINGNCTSTDNSGRPFTGVLPKCEVYIDSDVWFSFKTAQATTLYLRIDAGFEYLAALYSGNCNDLTSVFCDRELHYCDGYVTLEHLKPNTVYYLQVASKRTQTGYSRGQLCVEIKDIKPDYEKLNLSIAQECTGHGAVVLSPSATGGTSPYTYYGLGIDAAVKSGTTLLVEVTDADGCVSTTEVTSRNCDDIACALSTEQVVINDAKCFGDTNASISLTPSGGLPPYQMIWSDGSVGSVVAQLSAGTYQLTLTDEGGCESITEFAIQQPNPIDLAANIQNILCPAGNDGQIAVLPSGGTPPYTYLWSDGSQKSELTALSAGQYQLTLTDDHLCALTFEFSLSSPQVWVLVTDSTQLTITDTENAYIGMIVEGATPPYQFLWYKDQQPTDFRDLVLSTNLPGSYQLVVTDANGCTFESEEWKVDKISSTGDALKNNWYAVFPNPTINDLWLKFKTNPTLQKVTITDLNGVVLQIQSENASSGPYHYDVSQLPAGVYFINWQVAGSWFTSKWVKIK